MDDAAPAPPLPLSELPARDWSLLPIDVVCTIFVKVGAVDVLMGAGLVCHSWLEAAKLPEVWRVVDMENHKVVLLKDQTVLRAMARVAVHRSGGQLRAFSGKLFVTHKLMKFIVDRSPCLTTLRLVSCRDVFSKRLAKVTLRESPLLELRSLELDDTHLTVGRLSAILESCPPLEVLRVRNCFQIYDDHEERALREKFPAIMILTLECDDEFRYSRKRNESRYGYDYDDERLDYVPDFEDLRIE